MLAVSIMTLVVATPVVAPKFVGERSPMIVLVLSPKGVGSGATSKLIDGADRALRENTGLRAIPSDRAGVDAARLRACPHETRLACWIRHIDEARVRSDASPAYLLVLGVLPFPDGGDQVTALSLDVAMAKQILSDRGATAVDAATVRGAPTRLNTDDVVAVDAYFSSLFDRQLRGAFERSGHWRPYGSIAVRSNRAGAVLELDGRTVGLTGEGLVQLDGVIGGDRTVVARFGDGDPVHREVVVHAGQQVEVTFEFATATSPVRKGMFWGGVATGVAGIVLLAASPAFADGRPAACIVRPGADASACPTGGGPTLSSYDGALPATSVEAVTSGGALVIPLGAALAAAGATWATAAQFWGEPDTHPWWGLVIGVGLGAAAYGIGAALDPAGAPER